MKYIKEDVKIEVFTDHQIKQMLSYYRRLKRRDLGFYVFRNYTIIVTLLGTGIRLGELVNLEWKNVGLINRNMIIFGKNRITRNIPIAENLTKELAEYKIYCRKT